MLHGPIIIVKKCSARKSLRLFIEILDVKKKTDFGWVGAAKSNHKAIREGSMHWSSITNKKVPGYCPKLRRTKARSYHWAESRLAYTMPKADLIF